MSFVWADYYQLCEALLKNASPGLEEATFRCVCSRAYYAAFCTACEVAQTTDGIGITGMGDDHGIVFRHFKNHTDDNRYRIGVLLRSLRDNRNQADYDANAPVSRTLAEALLADARNILDALAKLTP